MNLFLKQQNTLKFIHMKSFSAQNEDWGAEKVVFTPTAADGNGANIEKKKNW